MAIASAALEAPAASFLVRNGTTIRRAALVVYAGLFFLFLYAPIGLLMVLSVNDSEVIGLPFKGTTLRWYEYVLTTPALLHALLNSFALGFVAAGIATALAVMMAMGFRRDFPMKGLLMKIVLLPILIPGIVGSAVFLVFFGYLEIPFGLWTTALMVHITWTLPFAFLTIFPRLHGFDRGLEEAAMDLGATPVVAFRRIMLPIIRPGIIATFLFAFTLSFDEFIRTFMVIGSERTIPVHLWTLIIDQMAPFLPAVGMVIMAVSVTVSLVGFAITLRDK
jgi:ABC-type spermidine/putrescine transport system permease subunit II